MTTQATWLLIVAIVTTALIPLAPRILAMRIWLLRRLRLNWFADLHENHFRGWVIGIRVALTMIALTLYYLALGQ